MLLRTDGQLLDKDLEAHYINCKSRQRKQLEDIYAYGAVCATRRATHETRGIHWHRARLRILSLVAGDHVLDGGEHVCWR